MDKELTPAQKRFIESIVTEGMKRLKEDIKSNRDNDRGWDDFFYKRGLVF